MCNLIIWIIIGLFILNSIFIYFFTGYRLKDFYTPKKWLAFIIGKMRKIIKWYDGDLAQPYLTREQMANITLRTARCFECLKAGHCLECQCDIEEKMNDPHETCSLNRWGSFKSPEAMRIFLEERDFHAALTSTIKNNGTD